MAASSERSQLARIAALTLHSRVDGKKHTERARNAFLARFEDEVDPARELPEAERLRRAEIAKRRYFADLALKSARARRSRKVGA